MSHWEPCVKCGLFVSAGMGENLRSLTCSWCTEDDDVFDESSSVEKGDVVSGKHFERGTVEYVGMETEVEVIDSQIFDQGELLTVDKSYLKLVE